MPRRRSPTSFSVHGRIGAAPPGSPAERRDPGGTFLLTVHEQIVVGYLTTTAGSFQIRPASHRTALSQSVHEIHEVDLDRLGLDPCLVKPVPDAPDRASATRGSVPIQDRHALAATTSLACWLNWLENSGWL